MKLKTSTLLLTFIWCWFMGITAISIGFGALFPSMNRVAKPFVCPSGKMDLTKEVYNPYPENTIARMKELKELRAANLISENEYEEKRAEILKDL